MDWHSIAQTVGVGVTAIGAWITIARFYGRKGNLERLSLSLEIFEKIPESWESREAAKKHLEAEIRDLFHAVSLEDLLFKRNREGDAVAALIFLSMTIFGLYLFFTGSPGWGAGCFILGVAGFIQAVRDIDRTQK